MKNSHRLLGRPLVMLPVVQSTNGLLKAQAEMGVALEGAVVCAEHQTAGRGRFDRQWEAPPGRGLLFSTLLIPAVTSARLPLLSLMAALAVDEALRDYFSKADVKLKDAVRLKWPNDLLIGSGKVCGILCEGGVTPSSQAFVVVGIGLNVNQRLGDFSPSIRKTAASLYLATGREHDRNLLLESLLLSLEKNYIRLKGEGDGWIAGRWLSRANILAQRVTVSSAVGRVSGKCEGILDDGALQLRDDSGFLHIIYTGDML